ncbi:hypothetical protein NW759_007655 [Fusarium solani]|nr:hypothetical protein NW759_007655 [Fusarium solani]
MSVFFVDWELWQEMTFASTMPPLCWQTTPRTVANRQLPLQVLGCCIVLVFALGLIKLWWTNRAMRRLEIIDEEKRARVSLMSHCGIENLRPPEIPFGIRAIQNGVQVEGIWISRPDTPGSSHNAPGATLVGHRVEMSKGKGRMIELVHIYATLSESLLRAPKKLAKERHFDIDESPRPFWHSRTDANDLVLKSSICCRLRAGSLNV